MRAPAPQEATVYLQTSKGVRQLSSKSSRRGLFVCRSSSPWRSQLAARLCCDVQRFRDPILSILPRYDASSMADCRGVCLMGHVSSAGIADKSAIQEYLMDAHCIGRAVDDAVSRFGDDHLGPMPLRHIVRPPGARRLFVREPTSKGEDQAGCGVGRFGRAAARLRLAERELA